MGKVPSKNVTKFAEMRSMIVLPSVSKPTNPSRMAVPTMMASKHVSTPRNPKVMLIILSIVGWGVRLVVVMPVFTNKYLREHTITHDAIMSSFDDNENNNDNDNDNGMRER